AWWEHHRHRNDDRGGRNQTTGTATRTRARFDLACHPVKPVQCSSADPGTRRATRGTRHRPAGSCSEGGHRARDRNGFCCARARASRRAARRRRYVFRKPANLVRRADGTSCDTRYLPMEVARRRWRPDELRSERARCLSANWCLHRPRAERRKTRRPADRAADQVRAGHQQSDREGSRPDGAADAARPRRRGDRMTRRSQRGGGSSQERPRLAGKEPGAYRATTMFVHFRETPYGLAMSLVENRRENGRICHEHIANLGSIETPPSVAARIEVWRGWHERLCRLSHRLDAETRGKVMVAVHARVPIVTPEEQRAS